MRKIRILIRNIKHAWQRLTKKYDRSLSWDLGYYSLEQMKIGLDYFLEDAPEIVDLTFHKIEYRNKIYTLEELLKIFHQVTTYLYNNYNEMSWCANDKFKDIYINNLNAYMELYKILIFYLWW